MTVASISEQSQVCLELLEYLCASQHKKPAFESAKETFKGCLGRYNIWTGNVGSLQNILVPTSLEHRLQPAPRIAGEYRDLLENLADELRRAFEQLPIQSLDSEDDEDAVSVFEELARTVDSTITDLFRLSSIVRRRAPRDRFVIAQHRVLDLDVLGEPTEAALVGDLFKRLKSPDLLWLKERLGRANNARRKFLRYSTDHRRRVSDGAPSADTVRPVKRAQNAQQPTQQLQLHSANTSVVAKSELSAQFTVATTVAMDDRNMLTAFKQADYRSVVSDGSVHVKAGKLHPMSLEEASAGKTDFECPYCKILVSMDGRRRWYKHVYADLKAYVCSHEECEMDVPLFDSASSWMAHEISHFYLWQCPQCADSIFKNEKLLEDHLASAHPRGLSSEQIHALAKAYVRPCTSVPASACHFCDWASELRASSSVNVDQVPLKDYRRHMAAHLEQVALITTTAQKDLMSDSEDEDLKDEEDTASFVNTNAIVTAAEATLAVQKDLYSQNSDSSNNISQMSLTDLPTFSTGLTRPLESPTMNTLRLIAKAPDSTKPAVNIVLVSLPWLLPCEEWYVTKYHRSDASIGNAAIYAFEDWRIIPKNFTWSLLRDYGQRLADSLLAMCRSTTRHSSKAILLMAHSLAGNILKHCLVLMHRKSETYRLPRDTVRGVVFMGSPHCSASDRHALLNETSANILKLGGFTGRVQEKSSTLLSICQEFSEVPDKNIPIVSLYEASRLDTNTPGVRPSTNIVDKRLTMIDAYNDETLTSIDTDHRFLPTLQDGNSTMNVNKHALRNIRQLIRTAQDDFDLELDKHVVRDPALPCFVYAEARERNKDFHGREKVLSRLHQCLVRNTRVAVVHGPGGVGKSDVAIEFAYRHKKDFDAVFWIPADDIDKMRQVFSKSAVRLGLLDEAQANDPHSNREVFKAWLEDPKLNESSDVTARWLIIFDGADIATVLSEFEPVFCRGSVLVTTQDQYLPNKIPCPSEAISSIPLEFFEPEDAALLLRKMATRPGVSLEGEDDAAREIVRRHSLGGSPLAISQLARTIRDKLNVKLSEFLEIFDFEKNQAEIGDGEGSHGSMAKALKLASLARSSTELLQVCAMLDADCIQESLIYTHGECALQLKHFPVKAIEFASARAGVLQTSLMQRNSEKHQLWMHRVVRDTVLGTCSDEEFNASFQSAAALVRHAWKAPQPQLRDNRQAWKPIEIYLGHVLHLQSIYSTDLKVRQGSSHRIEPSFDFAWLLCQTASYKTNVGETVGVRELLDLALSICEALPATESQTFDLSCNIYHYLGAWANETNHPQECFDYNSRYLEMRRNSGGDPDERLAATYNQYGTGLMMLRKYDEAVDAFQRSIELYATVPTATACPDSLPIVNLAVARWLMDDYDGAYSLLESGLMARQEAFPHDDTTSFRTGRFLHTLGNVRWDQKKYDVSKIWHLRALKHYEKTLVNAHHRTADVRHRLAQHFLREGDCEKAVTMIEQALRAWREDPSSFRQEISRTTWLKARVHERLGNHEKASLLRGEATKLRQQIRPEDQRSVSELDEKDFDDLVAFWSR